ncbi:hypothetical protein CPB86DRAFT_86245 [Serendipita vermifera]|nr:hypothetical protein CPB86DRAFT_86245 [Serendipita vermifera]
MSAKPFSPPPRPFLDPPPASSIPKPEEIGLHGANAWAYGVSTRLMNYSARWEFFNQVQTGLVWLDEYVQEIEERINSAQDEEEIDFVDLVKTPGRNKSQVHGSMNSYSTANAEKLAKANALHFSEIAKMGQERLPAKTEEPVARFQSTPNYGPGQDTTLPASSTAQTIRPPLSHNASSAVPLPVSNASHEASHPVSASVPTSAVVLSTTLPADALKPVKHFGPRPLPRIPNGNGTRSRTVSNASIMSQLAQQPFERASSQPDKSDAQLLQHPSKKANAAPRTPSPIRATDPEPMEVEVPLNDTTTTTSIFPSSINRKPSFASLPNPSPVRKSIRGAQNIDSGDGLGHEAGALSTSRRSVLTTPGQNLSRKSGAPSSASSTAASTSMNTQGTKAPASRTSGWAKAAAAMKGRNPLTTPTDEKTSDVEGTTAINTVANATIGLPSSNTLKRKSEAVGDRNEVVAMEVDVEERASKALKTREGSFAMEQKVPIIKPASGTKSSASKMVNEVDMENEAIAHEASSKNDGEGDDTVERLLKLRGMIKSVGPTQPPRSSKHTDSRPPSAASSEHTRVDSTGKPSVSHLVGTWEEKKVATSFSPKQAPVVKQANDKSRAPTGKVTSKGGAKPGADEIESADSEARRLKVNTAARDTKPPVESTTPPDSPVDSAKSKAPVQTKQGFVPKAKGEVESKALAQGAFKAPENPSSASVSIFKTTNKTTTTKTSIFSAPPKGALQTKPKAERGIFSRGPSMQYSATGAVSEEVFSQETEEHTDPLFDKPLKSAKLSTSTYHTASQPSQEDQMDDTRAKDKGSFGGWNDEGFTAGWLSKGNDTLGENAIRMQAQQQQVPGTFEKEGEDQYDERDWSPEQDEDVTNHQWGRIQPQADEEGSQPLEGDGDNETTSQRSELEDVDEEVDPEDDEDMAVDEEVEEDPETQPLEPSVKAVPSAPARGGILQTVGSFASMAASSLKSLRSAAAAAEKERIEKEKKEARMKEMEARRQAAIQKKAEEENKRREEFEKKRRAEEERRKKEKADTTLNRSLKLPKPVPPSTEKKQPEIKRQPSKQVLGNSTLGTSKIAAATPSTSKRAPTPTQAPTIKLIQPSASTSSLAAHKNLTSILGPTASKNGDKVRFEPNPMTGIKTNIPTASSSTTSLLMTKKQVQQAQIQASTTVTGAEEDVDGIDEAADLPDIRSEYSDSEDENRPTYDLPDWAQSPDLRQALEHMRTVNPDTIFGAMPQLKMDEIFPGRRKSKFRARTSSANWAGTDGVTVEEEIAYARRMGFEN